jgi:hypothetical protein
MAPASERSEAILHYTSGQMMRAFGADDVARSGSSPENYVFR